MKKAILVATIGAITLGANAGDWGKAPVGKAPIEECVDLGGEISVGYDTDYVFYGVRFARDSVWTDVNYTFDNLAVPITVGAWYLNGINGGGAGYDELDLYVDLALGTFAGFDVTAGYTHFAFPEARSNVTNTGGYGEADLSLSRSLGFVDLTSDQLRHRRRCWHSRELVSRGRSREELRYSPTASASCLVAVLAYSDGYFGGSGWNHYYRDRFAPDRAELPHDPDSLHRLQRCHRRHDCLTVSTSVAACCPV
jgi:hypothetical protein